MDDYDTISPVAFKNKRLQNPPWHVDLLVRDILSIMNTLADMLTTCFLGLCSVTCDNVLDFCFLLKENGKQEVAVTLSVLHKHLYKILFPWQEGVEVTSQAFSDVYVYKAVGSSSAGRWSQAHVNTQKADAFCQWSQPAKC